MMSSGISMVCCGEGLVWGVGAAGRFRGFLVIDGAVLISVA